MKNWLQKRLINILAKNLFNTVTEDDILKVRQGGVYLRGRKLDKDTLAALQEDAEKYSESTLWKIISNEVKQVSNLRMYEKGTTSDDILAGKIALYVLEVIEKIQKRLRDYGK